MNTSNMKSSFVAQVNITHVGNLSKAFVKTTLVRIRKTFSKIYKEFRHQRKQMTGVSQLGTTQEIYLSCSSPLFLLILVPSRPNAMLNRIAIRLSWAKNSKLSKEDRIGSFIYQVVFMIKKHAHSGENGSLMEAESRKFGDILQVEHDNKNLTIISAMKRLLKRKCNPEFLLVLGDDNTYVNVPEIVSWLSKLKQKVKHGGSVREHTALAVDYLSNTSIKVITFQGAYVLAGKILKEFLYATRITSPTNDDINGAVYLGTLTKSLGIKPYNNSGYSHTFEDLNIPDIDPCAIKKEVFVNDVFRARHILLYAKMIVVREKPCVKSFDK
jgi:hypothetical protein